MFRWVWGRRRRTCPPRRTCREQIQVNSTLKLKGQRGRTLERCRERRRVRWRRQPLDPCDRCTRNAPWAGDRRRCNVRRWHRPSGKRNWSAPWWPTRKCTEWRSGGCTAGRTRRCPRTSRTWAARTAGWKWPEGSSRNWPILYANYM